MSASHSSPRCGGPRQAVLELLASGVVGTFDALASMSGQSDHRAVQKALENLRSEGVAEVCGSRPLGCRGRPRAVYGLARMKTPFDSLAFARHAWR